MKKIVVLTLALALAGCTAPTKVEDVAATSKMDAAVVEIDVLKIKVGELENIVALLQDNSSVTLAPDQTGYSVIDSDDSAFMVKLKSVAPHADGIRVTLEFCNPYSVVFDGITISADWGARLPRGDDAKDGGIERWAKSLNRQNDISVNTILSPGRWSNVVLTLAPARIDDFGYLRLWNMQTNKVRASR